MQTKLKPLVVALAFALAANVHTAWSADEAGGAVPSEKTTGDSKAVDDAAVTEMSPIQVRGVAETYKASKATTATRMDTPIKETPFSIQVITEEVMQDQQAYRLEDVVKNVSGVRETYAPYSAAYEGLQARGFQAVPFRDGMRLMVLTIPLVNAERVEVLKGSAAIQYGRVEPGGMVNVVTKKPSAVPYYAIEQQIGSYNTYRTTADFTGPLNEDKTWLYRLNVENLDKKSIVNYAFDKRLFIAPSLTYQPSAATNITLSYEIRDEKDIGNFGIPAIGSRPAAVPVSSFYGEPAMNNHFMANQLSLKGEHQLTEQWTVRGGAVIYKGNYKYANMNPRNAAALTGSTLQRSALYSDWDNRDNEDAFLDIEGKFDALGMKHTVLLGTDYHRFHVKSNWYETNSVANPLIVAPIDIYNPVYGTTNIRSLMAAAAPNAWWMRNDQWNGIYLQDQMTVAEKWHVLLGGRYDQSTMSSGFAAASMAAAQAAEVVKKENHFSPMAGLTYQATDWLSLYGSYSEAFGSAGTARTAAGTMVDPQTSQQYEVGAKTEFLDGRIAATVAVYELTKKNVATPDPANPGFSLAIGEIRSQGIEFDVSGKITSALSLTASYANSGAVITKMNNGTQGQRYTTNGPIPRNSGSVWLKYDVPGEELHGLSVGGGVFAASQAQGDGANTFQLPGYARIDAFAAYKLKLRGQRVTAQLNVNNLFNKTYYPNSQNRATIFPGEPRMVMGSVKVEF